jgi:hypothetical protein
VRTILAMSHGLNIKVVAEGVETPEQLRFLRRRRCDEAQGYLFARPISAAEFPAAVEAIRRERHHDLRLYPQEVPAQAVKETPGQPLLLASRSTDKNDKTAVIEPAFAFKERTSVAS